MKNKIIFGTLVFLLCISLALAAKPHPETYWGYVYVDGLLAVDGTTLSVETDSGELLVSKVLPVGSGSTGYYSFKIKFDDPDKNATDTGADPGELLVWKIESIEKQIDTTFRLVHKSLK